MPNWREPGRSLPVDPCFAFVPVWLGIACLVPTPSGRIPARRAPMSLAVSERRCDAERSGDEQAETQHHDVAGRLCRRP
jgi:hypothetical protein